MQKPDITKLASTLSTKERMKFIITNWHKTVADKPFLNKAELSELYNMTDPEDFRECHYLLSLYQWSNILLREEIEKSWLKFTAGYTYLVNLGALLILDLIIKAEKQDGSLLEKFEVTERSCNPETGLEIVVIKEKTRLSPNPKEIVLVLNQHIQVLFGYREIFQKIEAELDDIPIFDEKTYEKIRGYWAQTEKFITYHNNLIGSLEKEGAAILVDKEQYLLKVVPSEAGYADQWVKNIKNLAETDSSLPMR